MASSLRTQQRAANWITNKLTSQSPTSPSRCVSNISATRTAKSRILEMLDREMESLLASPTPSPPSTPQKRKLKTTTQTSTLRVTGTNSAKPIHPFFERTTSTSESQSQAAGAQLVTTSIERLTYALETELTNIPNDHQAIFTEWPPKEHVASSSQATLQMETPIPIPTTTGLFSYRSYSPPPTLVYTYNEHEANELVKKLEGPLGFDLEWRVILRRGVPPGERRTALVQLCDKKTILLIQVNRMANFPRGVKEVIESPQIVKMGANIRNDGQKLRRDFGILAENLVELGSFAHQADPDFSAIYKRQIVSLAKMVERYTSKDLDKGPVRSSDWERVPLSWAQQEYAANDAYSALMAYNRLLEIAEAHGSPLVPSAFTSNLRLDHEAGRLVQRKPVSSSSTGVVRAQPPAPLPAPSAPQPPVVPAVKTSYSSGVNAAVASASSTSVPMESRWRARPSEIPRPGDPPRPQHMRAYRLWHQSGMALQEICVRLRSPENPLKQCTVISYVVRALQADPSLPYSMERLKAFVRLEAGSWVRHREWIYAQEKKIPVGNAL